jgi:hypothetical protein
MAPSTVLLGCTLSSAIVVEMVESQESDTVFPAAEALPPVTLHHLEFDAYSTLTLCF